MAHDTKVNDSSVKSLVDELYALLQSLPTEQPVGSEDIYGLDTSIFWASEEMSWVNGGMGTGTGVNGQPG